MSGPLGVGDVLNLGRLAWDVYQLGWSEDLNATRQYLEFGKDVKGLAENLDVLTQVILEATSSLQRQGAYNAVPRWDSVSLFEIVGDYKDTLRECHELLQANQRYRVGSTAIRNIEWNVLVQPTADALRQRIMLHNNKVLHVLKPFEVDLLCRVRQDISRMHQDLAVRITAVHQDVHRLMGILVPDLEQELNHQAQRVISLLDVPIDIAERFRYAALADRPEYGGAEAFQLDELSDAFILNYNKSTVGFTGGLLVPDKIPPVDQYVNLLKCVWLFKRIQASPALLDASDDSHWPSYVRQLEEELSSECSRFGQELVKPELVSPTMRPAMFSIWPEREPTPLVDVVTQDEMMEQLIEVPLVSSTSSVEQKVKLLRRLGSDGRRFRVMISGTEQTNAGRPRRQTEVIDFDITSAIINPQYAHPGGTGVIKEIILRRDERIARMCFTSTRHLLKFQQAVTGFKAWGSYTQYNVMVSFVIAGRKEPVVEKACIQLWIPKETAGELVTNSEAADASNIGSPTRSGSVATSAMSSAISSSYTPSSRRDSTPMFSSPLFGNGDGSVPMGRQPSLPTIPQRQTTTSSGVFSTSWPRVMSPSPLESSPPRQGSYSAGYPPRGPITRRPVGQPPSPRRGSTQATTATNSTNGRSPSIFSAATVRAPSMTSNSSGSEGRSVISTGSRTTGFLHRRPPKPMLVLFTQSKEGDFSFVTVQIDEETAINPDRCNCRRAGRDGAQCPIAAIEQRKGELNLAGRRYETSHTGGSNNDWNIARLALNNPASSSDKVTWSNLRRLSIMFREPRDRATFSGTPNQCQCNIRNEGGLSNCLRMGHRGLWGEVQEFYRRQGNEYHRARFEAQQHVVNGLMT